MNRRKISMLFFKAIKIGKSFVLARMKCETSYFNFEMSKYSILDDIAHTILQNTLYFLTVQFTWQEYA